MSQLVRHVKPDRRATIALLFVLLSAGSAIFISFATLNYLKFYPALGQVQNGVNVDRLTFATGSGSAPPIITVRITISNPSDYSGLRIGQATAQISFFQRNNQSNAIFLGSSRLYGSLLVGGTLEPNSVRSVTVPISLTAQQSGDLAMFNSTYSGQVLGEVDLRVDIVTFLVSVTGSVPVLGTWDLSLS